MRILQLSSFDNRFGGAIAARRLHEALLAHGEECDFLVNEMQGDSQRTHQAYTGLAKLMAKARQRIDFLPVNFYDLRSRSDFSPNWVTSNLPSRVADFLPDIVHMHWCQPNFVPARVLPRLNRPIVWTFHDMWAFTGGCHYNRGCERYLETCGSCPVLNSPTEDDLSRKLWKLKQNAYSRVKRSVQVVCPSNWMAGLARKAPLLEGVPVHVLPNPINTQVFHPLDQLEARRLLGLPEKGPLLLMGTAASYDKRKGFDLLDVALKHYASQSHTEELGLIILGHKSDSLAAGTGKLKVHYLDFVSEETRLATIYNAVDAVALPSREENLSNMLAESLCCGTPCLVFGIGGNADIVTHQVNGYIAKPFDTTDLSAGLTWILANLRYSRDSIAKAAEAKLSYENLIPEFMHIYRAGMELAHKS